MRLKKGLTVKELMRKTGVYDTKILHFENLIINSIKPKELKKLTEEFKCSKEDVFKPVKVEKIGTSNRNVEYKVISYDVSEEELKKEIDLGLWDTYLFWDWESYQNMQNQNSLAITVTNMMNINANKQQVTTQSNIEATS